MSQPERRRSPRVAVGHDQGLPSGIVDIGLGGLSIALPFLLPHDSVHDIGLGLSNGKDVVLRLRVAHQRRELRADGPDVFVTGFEFLGDVTGQPALTAVRLAS